MVALSVIYHFCVVFFLFSPDRCQSVRDSVIVYLHSVRDSATLTIMYCGCGHDSPYFRAPRSVSARCPFFWSDSIFLSLFCVWHPTCVYLRVSVPAISLCPQYLTSALRSRCRPQELEAVCYRAVQACPWSKQAQLYLSRRHLRRACDLMSSAGLRLRPPLEELDLLLHWRTSRNYRRNSVMTLRECARNVGNDMRNAVRVGKGGVRSAVGSGGASAERARGKMDALWTTVVVRTATPTPTQERRLSPSPSPIRSPGRERSREGTHLYLNR